MATNEISARFLAELVRVLGALLEIEASSRPAPALTEPGFVVSIVGGTGSGELRVYFAREDAEALVMATTASAVEPSKTAVHDSLREICAQVAAVLDQEASREPLSVASVQLAEQPPDPATTTAVEIELASLGRSIRL